MKKLLVLAMMATLLMAGSAFAVQRNLTPAPNATFTFGAPGVAAGPTTTNNDDSCDIGVAPAATLLLPYFEVDVTNRTQTTLFTITNVTRLPQIAHVTIWTDWSFPVLDFNIYLTGYDVQGINLQDILVNGFIAQPNGTGPTVAQTQPSGVGALSAGFTANPNFAGGGASINCTGLPGNLSQTLVAAVRTALVSGVYNPGGSAACPNPVGGAHANGNAIGYVTIDVASSCSQFLPTDPLYYSTNILFDNVLIGDYQQLGPTPSGTTATSLDAGGNAMVHIRAIPEGGPAGTALAGAQTNLPYTFYDRYTPGTNRTVDRRQPLPALWAARYIQGGPGNFATNYKIWREGFGAGSCGASLALNGSLPVTEVVRFDEHENPNTSTPCLVSPCQGITPTSMPETSAQNTSGATFPNIGTATADVGGWMYLNLNNGGSASYSVTRNVGGVPTIITGAGSTSNLAPQGSATVGPRPSQNWVIVEMFGTGAGGNRLTVDFDAAWLGNGCSPAVGITGVPANPIAPAGGALVCPPLDPACTPGSASYPGTNTTPLP
jgi:hypothetical protein